MAGAALSRAGHIDPGPVAIICSAAIIILGALTVASSGTSILRSGLVIVWGGACEVCGLITGYPFGHYEYTDRWWPTVPLLQHRFPILVPISWLMIVGASTALAFRLGARGWHAWLLSGALAALIDLPMEAAMVRVFDYWRWIDVGDQLAVAPWTNAVGWFATAAIGAALFGTPCREALSIAIGVIATFCAFVAWSGALAGQLYVAVTLGAMAGFLLWLAVSRRFERNSRA